VVRTHSSRIALVYPYFRTRAPTELLFAPLGVAILAAHLHELGLEARVFDCTFSTFEQALSDLLEYQPEIVGIYCMISLSRNTFQMAEGLRQHLPDCLLVAGGPLPTLYPDHFAGAFHAIFRGEADESFPRLCQDFLRSKPVGQDFLARLPLKEYPGLYIHQNGLQIDNPPVHFTEKSIDAFPLPYRRDFDHSAYQEAGRLKDGRKTASLITTYGCPFDCDFCSRPVFGNRFRRRNVDKVLAEIDEIHQLGYNHLWIADDSFTLDPAYLTAFCRRMAGKDMTWSCLSRVSGLNSKIAGMMQAGGCRRVYLGLESGSPATLQLMNKKATVEAGKQAVHLFHTAGVEVAAFFIVGYPGETEASIEATFRLALDLPLDEISFNVPFPLPGSKLFERVIGLDKNKDWNQENEVTFVYHSEFDQDWLRERIDATMRQFEANKKTPNSKAVKSCKKEQL